VVILDKNVRMIMLRFNFSNPKVIPFSMRRKTHEPLLFDRKRRSTGVLNIETTAGCSLADFVVKLNASGYEMVDAFYRKRVDGDINTNSKKKYHTVFFLFARHEFAELSDEFKKMRNIILAELRSMCENAMWQVKLFSNKFYKDGREVQGQKALSINLGARQPLCCPDGQAVRIWQKDEKGKRIGGGPIPLKASYCLSVENNIIELQTA